MAISKIKSNSIADDAITSDKVADGTLVASDLLDNTITGAKLATDIDISTSGNITTTGDLTGTLATASQPNITSVGTLTSFTSTGIDDNATANALTIDSSSNLQFNSGYGSVATAYGCRAWVNFNGTGTVAINASGNVSSITDNGTGDYTINFATAMPDNDYSFTHGALYAVSNGFYHVYQNQTTTSCDVLFVASTNALADSSSVSATVHR